MLILFSLSRQSVDLIVGRGNASLIRAGEGGSHLVQNGQIQCKALGGQIRSDGYIQIASIGINQIFIKGSLQLSLHQTWLGLKYTRRITSLIFHFTNCTWLLLRYVPQLSLWPRWPGLAHCRVVSCLSFEVRIESLGCSSSTGWSPKLVLMLYIPSR